MICEFLTGPAGTGKTTELRRRIEADPKYGVLASTTGISAINLGTITINSLLKYFDTESMADSYFRGRLIRALRGLAEDGYKNLCIDECSMMDATQLDILYQAGLDLEREAAARSLNLILTGDFCQLPPIKAKWCFEADCWPEFTGNTTRLEKVWRQGDERFLEAVNLTRRGQGAEAASILREISTFTHAVQSDFDGTTILSKNDEVDRFNWLALKKLNTREINVDSQRQGKLRSEWKYIPETLKVKVGAYVMILSNDVVGGFRFANGDCGHVVDFTEKEEAFLIKLVRNGDVVPIRKIQRDNSGRNEPEGSEGEARFDALNGRWVYGSITYYPIRLAYASTVHKTQSLTLDRVQLDVRHGFFGSKNMVYVAVSRCRTPEGLRVVGTPEIFAKRVRVAEEVLPWL